MDISKCGTHQDAESVIQCQKHQVGYCQECFDNGLSCRDPQLYCKFRQQCVIWFQSRERDREERRQAD
jgi:hypothetical protein